MMRGLRKTGAVYDKSIPSSAQAVANLQLLQVHAFSLVLIKARSPFISMESAVQDFCIRSKDVSTFYTSTLASNFRSDCTNTSYFPIIVTGLKIK